MKYHIVTTESTHRITYLVKTNPNSQLNEIQELISRDPPPLELNQKWVGEKVIEVKELTDEQIMELLPNDG